MKWLRSGLPLIQSWRQTWIHEPSGTRDPIFGPEKCLKKFSITCCRSQMRLGPSVVLRIWTKIAHSNNLKMDRNCNIYDHVSNCSFGPLSKGSNAQFWSRFELRLWIKMHLRNKSNTCFQTPSTTFLEHKIDA